MNHTSRRSLLRAGLVGTFVATLAPAWRAAGATTTNLYSRTRFSGRLTATFQLSSATKTWKVRLDRVSDLVGAAKGAENAFELTFGSATALPPQGTYTLVRSGFAATPLFVVPSGPASHKLYAVVNRTA